MAENKQPCEVFNERRNCDHSIVATDALFWTQQNLVIVNVCVTHKEYEDWADYPSIHVARTPAEAQRIAISIADGYIAKADELLAEYKANHA